MLASNAPQCEGRASQDIRVGFGGLYFASVPGDSGMWWLFAYWGLTTILLFWGARTLPKRSVVVPSARVPQA